MTWTANSLALTLRSNIHCGELSLGFVARTFPYVPCHLPFFSLVCAAVGCLGLPDSHESYMKVERFFSSCVRSTPFYIRDSESKKLLFPWDAQCLETIESFYLGSSYGVPLDSNDRSAKPSNLYETEVILASRRKKKGSREPFAQTVLEGMIFIQPSELDDLSLDAKGNLHWKKTKIPFSTVFEHMHLGGDRRRSHGQPPLVALKKEKDLLFELYPVHTDGEWPVLDIPEKTVGPMPILQKDASNIEGKTVVLTGRRYTKEGAGFGMDPSTTAYTCGWKSKKACSIELSQIRFAKLCGN